MPGFNCANLDTIDRKYWCPTCSLILREPLQLGCGHRFCRECVSNQCEVIQCTQCVEQTQKHAAFADHGMRNDMQKLNIQCFHCSWNGFFKDYENHLNTGQFYTTGNDAIAQIQRLTAKLNEFVKDLQRLWTSRKRLAPTFTYALSIEETSPPEEAFQEQEHHFTSCDGMLMWKIDKIKSRFNDNQNAVLTSPAFHTSQYGYKMCVRLYLNGPTLSQATHVSMFLVVMQGDYDAILHWPFDFQVTFCLYNLTQTKQHMITSFRTNGESSSCQRPQGSLNTGTGVSKFIPLSALQSDTSPYVSEDSILVKVVLTKEPLPPWALSKIMGVNPAWPLHLHTEMLTKELERYRRQPFKLTLTLKSRSS